MKDIKNNRRSIKEITKEVLNINKRKSSVEELNLVVKIINENSITEDDEIMKISIKLKKLKI